MSQSKLCREGYYTKYSSSNKTVLAFTSKNDQDNYFKILTMLREYDPKFNTHQNCEPKEEQSNFETIFFIFYNIWGQQVKAKMLHFDFENETVTTEQGRTYKVKKDSEYVYKIQKTQIKAIDGIKGLYEHIVKTMDVDSPLNTVTYNIIEKLDTQHVKTA